MTKHKLITVPSLILGLLVGVCALQTGTAHASASACPTTSLRSAVSSNTVYVDGASTVCTAADVNARYPAMVVKQANSVYLVKVNLKLTNGATFQAIGTSAGGDTDQLRLLSDNTSTINITADWGEVNLQNTAVTSWDEAKNGPDTDYTGQRAFVRVRSSFVNGQALTSRMDIVNSDVGYLGYYAAESYGLAWKVLGGNYASVDVLGNITGSRIHHNYFGVYTYGAFGMQINGNEFDHNAKYGLDPHDDSDSLTITNNRSHDNGNHGIICSQRCDHLVISGNESYNNVGHGIMLHRSTDFNLVENNNVHNNTDTGIALFESNNNTVRGNTVTGNKHGIRLSVGSSNNRFKNNTVVGSTSYGIYTYKGSDAPARPGNDGINRGNTWSGNAVKATGSKIMKLGATDQDAFTSNDFRGNPGVGFDLKGATETTYTSNQTDPGIKLP